MLSLVNDDFDYRYDLTNSFITCYQTLRPAEDETLYVSHTQYKIHCSIRHAHSEVTRSFTVLTHVAESPGIKDFPPHAFSGAFMPSQRPPLTVIETSAHSWLGSWAIVPSTKTASSMYRIMAPYYTLLWWSRSQIYVRIYPACDVD